MFRAFKTPDSGAVACEVVRNRPVVRKFVRGRKKSVERLLGALHLVQGKRSLNSAGGSLWRELDDRRSRVHTGIPIFCVGVNLATDFQNVGMNARRGWKSFQVPRLPQDSFQARSSPERPEDGASRTVASNARRKIRNFCKSQQEQKTVIGRRIAPVDSGAWRKYERK